jgi:phytoene desaturase
LAEKISIVGAGVGGLSLAARLASRGYEIDIYERLSECGGRAHIIRDKGFVFDTGPSFVLMPEFFGEVFSYCQQDIKDYLNLKALDTSYKIFYADGEVLTVYKDSEKTKQELERLEPGASSGYDKFLKEIGQMYSAVKPLLYKPFYRRDILNPKYWSLLPKLKIFLSYWKIAKKFFKSERLCYAFTFEAMFIGVSPFVSPAFYSIITYVDHKEKIYHPLGGMYEIPKALEKIALKFGARINYNFEIEKILQNNNKFILKSKQGDIDSEKVAVNADYSYSQESLLRRPLRQLDYSCSVYLLYLGLKRKVSGLAHHNLFFSSDLRRNLKEIFDSGDAPIDPSFYVHVPTVTDPGLAPEGKSIAYILVPIPNLEKSQGINESEEERLRKIIFSKIKLSTGIDLEDLIEVEHKFYPKDFISRYNIKNAATFGLAHTFSQSAFFRPYNNDQTFKGLYYVGASTQPGGGLPTVIASSKIVADMITGEAKKP